MPFDFLFRQIGEGRQNAGGGRDYIYAFVAATLRHFHSNQIGKRANGNVGRLSAALRHARRPVAGSLKFLH